MLVGPTVNMCRSTNANRNYKKKKVESVEPHLRLRYNFYLSFRMESMQ